VTIDPAIGTGQPTVPDRVSCRVIAGDDRYLVNVPSDWLVDEDAARVCTLILERLGLGLEPPVDRACGDWTPDE